MASKVLFRLSRNRVADPIVRWGFAHLSGLLPVRRVASNSTVLAFHHPRPWKATHILLVPKLGIASLLSLDQNSIAILHDLLLLAGELAPSLDPGAGGATAVIINGGAYQDVGQLHVHLVAGPDVPAYVCPAPSIPGNPVLALPGITVFTVPHPMRDTHLVLQPAPASSAANMPDQLSEARLGAVVEATKLLARQRGLERTGYSLIVGMAGGELDWSCFHLVSGSSVPGTGRGSPNQ